MCPDSPVISKNFRITGVITFSSMFSGSGTAVWLVMVIPSPSDAVISKMSPTSSRASPITSNPHPRLAMDAGANTRTFFIFTLRLSRTDGPVPDKDKKYF